MEQGPSLQDNRFVYGQQIPPILWNLKVYYRTKKCPPSIAILSQVVPIHITTHKFLKIYRNTVFKFTPRSFQYCLSLRIPNQNPV